MQRMTFDKVTTTTQGAVTIESDPTLDIIDLDPSSRTAAPQEISPQLRQAALAYLENVSRVRANTEMLIESSALYKEFLARSEF